MAKQSVEVPAYTPEKKSLLDLILACSSPAQAQPVHLNVKFSDAMAGIWTDLCEMLLFPKASDLIRESVRLRALFADWDYRNKKIEVRVDGKEVDIYELLKLTRAPKK